MGIKHVQFMYSVGGCQVRWCGARQMANRSKVFGVG